MKALLNIQLVGEREEIDFQSSYEKQLKEKYPEINTFGLDNFSEAEMITYVQELVKQSDRILILVESKSETSNLNKLLKLFNTLIRDRFTNGKIVLLGEHFVLEKMAKVLGKNFHTRPKEDEWKKIVTELFS